MKFVDEANVVAIAGDGGAGCCSFFRARFQPRGAPDGGDGGSGGSVVFHVDPGLPSLVDIGQHPALRARNGAPGGRRCRHGANGADLRIPVPPGTIVSDRGSGELLGDLTDAGESLTVARGGSGGIGNARFKSGSNRSPRRTVEPGTGEKVDLRMELRLLADVGLLGLPNAGKSSLLRAISHARPKTGAYPFTTLSPQLGVVESGAVDELQKFTVADIPGLIAGAAKGAGLGNRFLRHLRRTALLLHVIDCGGGAAGIAGQLRLIAGELEQAGGFASATVFYVCNKVDLLDEAALPEVRATMQDICDGRPFFMVSALSGSGCGELCRHIATFLSEEAPLAKHACV